MRSLRKHLHSPWLATLLAVAAFVCFSIPFFHQHEKHAPTSSEHQVIEQSAPCVVCIHLSHTPGEDFAIAQKAFRLFQWSSFAPSMPWAKPQTCFDSFLSRAPPTRASSSSRFS